MKRIAIVDGGAARGIPGMVLDAFASRFELEETSARDADYVIHSCMGFDVLKYPGVRIYVAGENVAPDFNVSDYAMAFERMDYGDRNRWLPLIRLYPEAYRNLTAPRPPAAEIWKSKESFCAYTVSNLDDSAPERVEIFERLNEYEPVQSGGRWRNNVGGPVRDKLGFQSKARFVIAFENHSHPGYLTEKFAEAAQSNAIPIYWGDPGIADFFNPAAFVNCHDFPSIEAAVEEVKAMDRDPERCLKMMSEPWFRNGVEPDALSASRYESFLANIFETPKHLAYRRNLGRWGKKREKALRTMAFNPAMQTALNIKTIVRKWKGSR